MNLKRRTRIGAAVAVATLGLVGLAPGRAVASHPVVTFDKTCGGDLNVTIANAENDQSVTVETYLLDASGAFVGRLSSVGPLAATGKAGDSGKASTTGLAAGSYTLHVQITWTRSSDEPFPFVMLASCGSPSSAASTTVAPTTSTTAGTSTTATTAVSDTTEDSVTPSEPTTVADTTTAATPAPSTTTTLLGSDIEISTGTTIMVSLPSTGAHHGFTLNNPIILTALLLTIVGLLLRSARRRAYALHD